MDEATEKKKQDFSKVEFLTVEEGLCVHCMHIGSYDDEPATVSMMHEYMEHQKYGYLLNEEQISKLQSIIEEHDEKAKAEDTMWLLTVVQFEDEYTQALRDKMVELTKI